MLDTYQIILSYLLNKIKSFLLCFYKSQKNNKNIFLKVKKTLDF